MGKQPMPPESPMTSPPGLPKDSKRRASLAAGSFPGGFFAHWTWRGIVPKRAGCRGAGHFCVREGYPSCTAICTEMLPLTPSLLAPSREVSDLHRNATPNHRNGPPWNLHFPWRRVCNLPVHPQVTNLRPRFCPFPVHHSVSHFENIGKTVTPGIIDTFCNGFPN